MNVLIVQCQSSLARIWKHHLGRFGANVDIASSQDDAIDILRTKDFRVIILDLTDNVTGALAISDFANYRQPEARVVFVTNTCFFSDGSIFQHCTNARAFLPTGTPPDDLAAMVEHFATH